MRAVGALAKIEHGENVEGRPARGGALDGGPGVGISPHLVDADHGLPVGALLQCDGLAPGGDHLGADAGHFIIEALADECRLLGLLRHLQVGHEGGEDLLGGQILAVPAFQRLHGQRHVLGDVRIMDGIVEHHQNRHDEGQDDEGEERRDEPQRLELFAPFGAGERNLERRAVGGAHDAVIRECLSHGHRYSRPGWKKWKDGEEKPPPRRLRLLTGRARR